MQTYALLVTQFARDAGAVFYDEVVRPFVARLARDGHKAEARAALVRARDALAAEVGSQLDQEMEKLAVTLK